MELLKYKNYTWPRNPGTYRETLTREPVYAGEDGAYSGMSQAKRVISGSGEFAGSNAYSQFLALLALAEEDSVGTLVHPVFGSRDCYFTRLELDQEPRENYVAYRFEFTQAEADGSVPK